MTDDNSNLVDMDNLDTFSDSFYEKPADIEVEEVADTSDDAAATSEDKDASAQTEDDDTTQEDTEETDSEDETSEPDNDGDEEVEKEPEPKGKGKGRKSAQERINEITRRAYDAERREAELIKRLEALESREHQASKQEPAKEHLPQGAPDPDAVDEDGEPIYPAGQYDPDFVRDLALFTVKEQIRVEDAAKAERAKAAELERAKEELRTEWSGKLDAYQEVNPDIREDLVELVDTFKDVEPSYGEYLAMTLMQSENGPAIVEYLSQNIGEAQKIVASGPAAATLAIGRLDARMAKVVDSEEKRNSKIVSHAPEPPTSVAKGRKGAPTVRPDTDDQDAFERLFYKK